METNKERAERYFYEMMARRIAADVTLSILCGGADEAPALPPGQVCSTCGRTMPMTAAQRQRKHRAKKLKGVYVG